MVRTYELCLLSRGPSGDKMLGFLASHLLFAVCHYTINYVCDSLGDVSISLAKALC